jgi:DNA topoisomerase-1
MKPAVYDVVNADIINGDYGFKANGRRLVFDGFLKVYSDHSEEKDKPLPPLAKGQSLELIKLNAEQKFTEGPSRFTEASLIKELEDKGIGRPSTYASIVSTLDERRYVRKDKKSLMPTDLGIKVTEIMEEYFREIVDTGFTAEMEEKLDSVAEGGETWQTVVSDYYDGYIKEQLNKAAGELERVKVEAEPTGEICPQCGRPLVRRQSRYGEFVGCSGYPSCRYIKPNIVNIGVKCPKCGADIIRKKSKKGKIFYGCSAYPQCDQVYWYKPVDKKCPDCGSLLTERGKNLVCSNQDCGYSEPKPAGFKSGSDE